MGTAVSSNKLSSGFEPTRSRALENADLCGTTSGTDGSIARKPSLENRQLTLQLLRARPLSGAGEGHGVSAGEHVDAALEGPASA